MNIRIIDLNAVSPLYSQAVYHGLANNISDNDDPILVLVKPSSAYICVGLHQDIHQELNHNWCMQNKLSIIRRNVGGGTVLLDENQLFFQFIFPKRKAPARPQHLYNSLLKPLINTYERLGLTQVTQTSNDIHINGKKICGTGAASIESATVLVGSFLFKFDYSTMARCVNASSEYFSEIFRLLMQQKMVVINDLFETPPSELKIIQLLKENIRKDLNLSPIDCRLSNEELESIQIAAKELQDDEWTFQPGKRLIKNGIKIAAGTYLLEKTYAENNNLFSLRVLLTNEIIEKIWVEMQETTEKPLYQSAVNEINLRGMTKRQCYLRFSKEKTFIDSLQDLLEFNPY